MIKVKDRFFKTYMDQETIDKKVVEMADEIQLDFRGKDPLFIVVLNGAFRFAADLARNLKLPAEWQFVQLSSYRGTESQEDIVEYFSPKIPIAGRHLVIVEDIVDTGNTMTYYLRKLEKSQPASVQLVSLFVKEDVFQNQFPIYKKGFSIPDDFIIGYGLDYDEAGRNLDGIWQVTE